MCIRDRLVSNASFQRVDCLIRGAAQVHIRIALRKFHLPGADVYGTGFPHHISAYMGVLISGAFLRFSNSIDVYKRQQRQLPLWALLYLHIR